MAVRPPMLLKGRHMAMPVPGLVRCMVVTNSFISTSLHAGVTTDSITDFSVASRPR